jgi:plastocyanin
MRMPRKAILASVLAVLFSAAAVWAADHVVGQKNRAFSTNNLKAKVGDTVSFRNDDPFFHNIFSLSETQSFDLGSYSQGQSKQVTLQKPGRIDVECAIHPEMKMVIEVSK